MSLKHPRVYNSRRCAGRDAVNVRVDKDSWRPTETRVGQCPACGRWFDVTRAGRVRPHFDYRWDLTVKLSPAPAST